MILGILSDTHGRHQRAARARRVLERVGAREFVHCGDVGGVAVFEQFRGDRFSFVWGNTDIHDAPIEAEIAARGFTLPAVVPLRIRVGDASIAVYHGHEREFASIAGIFASMDTQRARQILPEVQYVLYGHTHEAADLRVGHLRLINPGALQRARVYTVATLDVQVGTVRFWRVDDDARDAAPTPWFPDARDDS